MLFGSFLVSVSILEEGLSCDEDSLSRVSVEESFFLCSEEGGGEDEDCGGK